MAGGNNVFTQPFNANFTEGFTAAAAVVANRTALAAAIFAAIGFEPAASSNVGALAAGSAAAPALSFAADLTKGLYSGGTNALAWAVNAKQGLVLAYRDLGYDNMRVTVGATTAIGPTGGDSFVATLDIPTLSMTGASSLVAWNIGSNVVNIADTIAKSLCNIEIDKFDVYALGGAVTVTKYQAVRARFGIMHTDVTCTAAIAYDLVMPNTVDVTGAVTTYIGYNVPTMSASGGANFIGMYYNNKPANGSVATAGSVEYWVNSGGTLTLSTPAAYTVDVKPGGNNLLARFGATSSAGNYWKWTASDNPILQVLNDGGGNVAMQFYTQGSGSMYFGSRGSTRQVEVVDRSGADRTVQLKGGVAGASFPRVYASSGNIVIGRESAISTTATDEFMMIAASNGPPTGVPTGASTGLVTLSYDYANNKFYAYNAGWKGVTLS